MSRVQIQITGAEHTSKTRMAVLIARLLEQHGAKVVLQQADPELQDKLQMTDEQLGQKLDDVEILITEMKTFGR